MKILISIFLPVLVISLCSFTNDINITAWPRVELDQEKLIRVGSIESDFKTVKDYGAKGDGKTDDTKAIQLAIDSGNEVIFERGNYLTRSPLIIRNRTLISGKKAQITYVGSQAAIKANTLVLDVTIINLGIEARSDGAKAMDISNFSYSNLNNVYLIIKGKNSVCLYMQGNGKGSGPYYNSITNSYFIGSNDVNIINQRGIVLDENTSNSKFNANGANGNIFSNIKRIAGLSIAVDIISGNGNMFSNINTESIQDFHFRFNYRKPDFSGKISSVSNNSFLDYNRDFKQISKSDVVIRKSNKATTETFSSKVVGFKNGIITTESHKDLASTNNAVYEIYKSKALGNVFSGIRAEGSKNSTFAKFCHGASDNRFTEVVLSSIGLVHVERETEDLSNRVGTLIPFVFQLYGVTENKIVDLVPSNSHRGGIALGLNCYVDAIQIKSTRSNNKGSCTANLKRSSASIPLQLTLTPTDRNTARAVTKKYIPSGYGLLRPNDGLQVSITTDSNWEKDDLIVTVWVTTL